MKIRDIGEIKLIKRFAKDIRLDKSVVKGSGDDAAVIKWTGRKYLLLTCDMVIEDVHFKIAEASPFQIGRKALARNISDIAAMGGIPRYALVSVGISRAAPISLVNGVWKGMNTLAKEHKINIVGGDMSASDKLVIDIALAGEVEKRNLVTRAGAKAGDLILVTGSLGGSIKGKHLDFTPRVKEARSLVKNFKINSMIDISDGLTLDLWRILDASEVGARIYRKAIPLSKDADSFEKAIYDGEDFELLFTMSVKEARRFFKTALGKMETPVSLIGEVTDRRSGYVLIGKDGKAKILKPKGYLHF